MKENKIKPNVGTNKTNTHNLNPDHKHSFGAPTILVLDHTYAIHIYQTWTNKNMPNTTFRSPKAYYPF
jgi:hypothetical protein